MPPTATETLNAPLQSLRLEPHVVKRISPGAAQSNTPSPVTEEGQQNWEDTYKYKRFLPSFDSDYKLPPLEPFEHVDPGHNALKDPSPQSFLEGATIEDLTPAFGSEVTGIQLHKLTNRERDQLALWVAQRGVVAFRDQEFIDQEPEWQLYDWGKYWGRLHIHPTSGQPKEFPEFHLVYRDAAKTWNFEEKDRVTSTVWHSDVSYELQPPGLTALFLYTSPPTGGDTGGAYNALSPSFRAYLETLEVLHSGVAQAEHSLKGNRGGVVKRAPVENIHPLVRSHPVTGEKALYINPQFSRRIIGLKIEESEALLKFLYDHIAKGTDFQTRLRWKPKTVVLWDNRITAHTAIVDFKSTGEVRHGARITPQAERPFLKKD
ncbi:TauD-domain-containing protein [Meredithblackwellia eburnea MCA 4105]